MMSFISIFITGLFLLVFVFLGVAFTVHHGRLFIAALRHGVIGKGSHSLSFQKAPGRFIGALVHIFFAFVAGVAVIAIVVLFLVQTFWGPVW